MISTPISPLRPVRLTDQIVESIRDHIMTSGLRPGDPLPGELELSRRFGVGRPTVREAMKVLAGMGFVQISNGRSPVVAALSGEAMGQIITHGLVVQQIAMEDTLQFRRFVEENSVALAATNRSAEQLAALEETMQRMRATVGHADDFAQSDIAFHRILASASGNALVSLVINGIAEAALASSLGGLRGVRTPDQWVQVLENHEKIFSAVEKKDAAEAVEAMRRHFDAALGWLHIPDRGKTETGGQL